jgi:hypothetical protein
MFVWKEIKSWAKKHGYESSKNEDFYSWHKASNPEINGQEKSVSRLATTIYNHISDFRWVEYQKEYKEKNGLS